MIYMLRGLFDTMCMAFTGQWWIDQQDALDPMPPAPLPHESDVVMITDADDDGPLPPDTGSERPACGICGDPNFSLSGDVCIACRIGVPNSKSPEAS